MNVFTLKNIAIFVYQNSIIVRGIEKRLISEGYHVDLIVDDVDRINMCASSTKLFILYLSNDILESKVKKIKLTQICDVALTSDVKMIVIGEMTYYANMIRNIPELNNFEWMNRPVDLDVLCNNVGSIMSPQPTTKKSHRILIVDDDPSYARMVREWLKETYQVDIVTNGMQAISFLLKNKIDLILLDYEMPVVDGPQVLQMLRSDPTTKDIPVFFLTGVDSKEGVTRVMSLKPDGYILKSTSKEKILNYLNKKLAVSLI
ncbi:MAG: response regulator [Butyrivibrio sp.]|nr:response regulator [Butyrivibrio sp.]